MNVLAIVLGNDAYPSPDKLQNAIADARAMQDVFNRLGYHTFEKYNYSTSDVPTILDTIEKELPKHEASIFYYAGHGFQVDGENFLPSVDCQISYANKHQLRHDSLVLSELLNLYKPHSRKTHIIILDACRVRPANRGGADSFAPIEAPQGTLIAFSTSPNSTAKDGGPNGHGLYTAALLSYMGRERMMVEELFKKVRRTVALWSNNTQIPWEHTSLIGDFSFNTGQMVVSPQIPYHEKVVKDANYDEVGEFAELIGEIRTYDFNIQNPAIDRICSMRAIDLDKNQQFIFGRNLLQSSSAAFSAQGFMSSLAANLRKYQTADGDNHVLNGILFEIYFDSYGEFRMAGIKRHFFEEIMTLNRYPEFTKSFNFIRTVINPYKENVIYTIPENGDGKLDVDITVREELVKNAFGEDALFSIVSLIAVNGKNITEGVRRRYSSFGRSLEEAIALETKAPLYAISMHVNQRLQKHIVFENKDDNDAF